MLTRVQRLWDYRKILLTLVRRDLRVRYARSVLGYLWTIIDPLSMGLIYFMIFVVIMKRADRGYTPYFLFLLVGLLVWQWFNAAVLEGARALLAEAVMVRSSNLPRELWIIRVVLAKGFEFLMSLPVLLPFVAYYVATGHTHLNWRLVLIPVAVVLQCILQVGICLALAPLTVLVEDTHRLVRIVLRMMFYLTPIVFLIDFVPGWMKTWFMINPLTGILELYRAGFFPNPLHWEAIWIGLASTAAWVVIGLWTFVSLERPVLKEI